MSNIVPGCLCITHGGTCEESNGVVVTAIKLIGYHFTGYNVFNEWEVDKKLKWALYSGYYNVYRKSWSESGLTRIDDGQLSREELEQYCRDLETREITHEL